MRKRNSNGRGLTRPRRADFRTNDQEYELMMRETYEASKASGNESYNDWICSRLFNNIPRRLAYLRAKHAKEGVDPNRFVHPHLQREKGIEPHNGRRPINRAA